MVEQNKITEKMTEPAEAVGTGEPASTAFDEVHALRKMQDQSKSGKIAEAVTAEFPALKLFGDIKESVRDAKAEDKGSFGKTERLDKELSKKKLFEGPPPLNRTEMILANGLLSSIKYQSVDDIQNALGALAEQEPKTAARILQHVRAQQEQFSGRSFGFVTGQDENSNPYVRMQITQRDGWKKDPSITSVTMDSRGESSATYRGSASTPVKSIDASKALQLISQKPDEPELRKLSQKPGEPELRHLDSFNYK